MALDILHSSDQQLTQYLQTVINDPNTVLMDEKPTVIQGLLKHLDEQEWQGNIKCLALEALKLLGRDQTGAEDLFSEKGFTTLMRLAGIAESAEFVDDECTHEALKCVYNCIFLHDGVKDYFESHKGIQISCRWLQQSPLSLPVQFLLCRILFFMAVRRPDIVDLIMTCNLASPMERILNENVDKLLAEPDMDTSQPINSVTVINEALKLLFSMTVTMEQKDTKENASIDSFKRSLVPIMKLVFRVPAPKPMPMTPPLSHAIHVLMQYPYEPMHEVWMADYESFVPIGTTLKDSRGYLVDTLTRRLQDTIDYLLPTGDPDHAAHSQHYNLDAALSPIILVIRTLAHGDVSARALFAQEMLPQSDREAPVHQNMSLSGCLIRLMTCTMAPQTRDAVSETLFVLCDENPTTFSQQVGYGNAIGYLVNKGIAMEPPHDAPESSQNRNINPITGQYLDAQDDGPSLADMTDEEKEREAERLFVLFERLKKTGIVDVENPVAKAYQQASIAPIDSDSDEE